MTAPSLTDSDSVKRRLRGAAVLAGAFLLYVFAFPGYFGNAFLRYVNPLGSVPHLGAPGLTVAPGDITLRVGDGLTVKAVCEEAFPGKVLLETGADSFPMEFDGQAFVFTFPSLSRPFSYRVVVVDNASGDGTPEMVVAKFPDALLIRNSSNLGLARHESRMAQDATVHSTRNNSTPGTIW